VKLEVTKTLSLSLSLPIFVLLSQHVSYLINMVTSIAFVLPLRGGEMIAFLSSLRENEQLYEGEKKQTRQKDGHLHRY
jgi:hypothetical protein